MKIQNKHSRIFFGKKEDKLCPSPPLPSTPKKIKIKYCDP